MEAKWKRPTTFGHSNRNILKIYQIKFIDFCWAQRKRRCWTYKNWEPSIRAVKTATLIQSIKLIGTIIKWKDFHFDSSYGTEYVTNVLATLMKRPYTEEFVWFFVFTWNDTRARNAHEINLFRMKICKCNLWLKWAYICTIVHTMNVVDF